MATLSESNGAGTQTVALSGTGALESFTVSPSSLAFGNEPLRVASAPMPVTVTNIGAAALPITSITFSGTNPGQFSQTSTCAAPIAVGSHCTISVVFKPASTGSKTATLDVKSSGAGIQTVALSGTGT